MNRRTLPAGLASLALLVLSPSLSADTVRVFAAASLTDALGEMSILARDHGTDLLINSAGSNTLVRQMIEGAKVDIVLTADGASMQRLVEAGRVDTGAVKVLLTNVLVIVAQADTPRLSGPADLNDSRFRRIAIADEATAPAGLYARTVLEAEGVWEKVKPRVVPTENVRGALAAVEAGNAQAALVYRTDAAVARGTVVIWEFTGRTAPEIVYPVAIPTDAPNPEAAARVLGLLRSQAAKKIFERHGFGVAEDR